MIFDQVKELVSTATAYDGDVGVFSCDYTAGGVCRLFEMMEDRPVHWHVCQLHASELRELIQLLDGKTA